MGWTTLISTSFLVHLWCPAWADDSAARVSVDLRDEYLAGEPLVVTVQARNETNAMVSFPDISSRPWLVSFEFDKPDGQKQTRSTTAPEKDHGRMVNIPPRGVRKTLVEVPSGAAIKPGPHSLAVVVDTGSGTERFQGEITLVDPDPVEGDLGAVGTRARSASAAWLHNAKDGYDLYLHQLQGKNLANLRGDFFLMDLDERVAPNLSLTRGGDGVDRHVYWQRGDRALHAVRLQGHEVRGEARSVELPWPVFSLLCRGATDGAGRLHVPVWIPGPRGGAGEVRVVVLGTQAKPAIRRVARLDAPPDASQMVVDAGGNVQLLIAADGNVDLYTLRGTGGEGTLPAPGRRLHTFSAAVEVMAVRFGRHGSTDTFAGGLSTLVVTATGSDPSVRTVEQQWYSMAGALLSESPIGLWPAGYTLLDVVPQGSEPAAILVQDSKGAQLWDGDQRIPIDTKGLDGMVLIEDGRGAIQLRALVSGGPIVHKTLTP